MTGTRGATFFPRMARVFSPLHARLYRRSGGRRGAAMRGAPVLLLDTVGARSGRARTAPLLYLEDGDRWIVVASFGGAPRHPGWYFNLRARPEASIQLGDETVDVLAADIEPGPEYDRLWTRLVAMYADYGKYERGTDRHIPVVALTRR